MKAKILKCIALLAVSIMAIGIMIIFEIKDLPVGSSLGGLVAGFTLEPLGQVLLILQIIQTGKLHKENFSEGKLLIRIQK